MSGAVVAITGVTGFVGSGLARALVDAGYGVRGVVRPSSDRSRLVDLPLTYFAADVTDADSLRGAFAGADFVVHAAGMLGQAGVPEAAYHRLHVAGTRIVLAEAMRMDPPPRVLYVSSPGVLGPITGPPADETTPPAPSNPYERSKAAAEQVALRFAADGLPLVIARPEFIYGPGDTHVLGLFRAVQRGLFFYVGSGDYVCHPTFVSDAVDGMMHCLENGRCGQIYHITGPQPVTFRRLAEAIAAALDVRPPWLTVPKPIVWMGAAVLEVLGRVVGMAPPLTRTGVAFFSEDRCFSWQKAHEELDYVPQVGLEEGIRKAVTWYRENGYL